MAIDMAMQRRISAVAVIKARPANKCGTHLRDRVQRGLVDEAGHYFAILVVCIGSAQALQAPCRQEGRQKEKRRG